MFERYEWTQCDFNLFPGFYNSVLSADHVVEYYGPDVDDRIYDFPDGESYKKYVHGICDYFVYEIQQKYVYSWHSRLDKMIRKMEFKELISPKFYNFETDRLRIDCEIDRLEILRYIFNHKREFELYLRENYTSRDGFWSFVKNSLAGILKQPEYFWDIALDFIFLQETEIEEEADDICEELMYQIGPQFLICINDDEIFDEDNE